MFCFFETVTLWLHLHLWRHRWTGWTTPPWAPADWQPSHSNLWWRAGPAVLFERPAVHNWMGTMTWHHNFIPTLIEMSGQGCGNPHRIYCSNHDDFTKRLAAHFIRIYNNTSWHQLIRLMEGFRYDCNIEQTWLETVNSWSGISRIHLFVGMWWELACGRSLFLLYWGKLWETPIHLLNKVAGRVR